MTRCKFICSSVRKYKSGNEILFDYEFNVVISGSEENKKFFKYTPCGKINFSTVREDNFEIGKEYYFDISESNN